MRKTTTVCWSVILSEYNRKIYAFAAMSTVYKLCQSKIE